MYEEVRTLLSRSGLSFIFKNDPGCYDSMTMEFLCSFTPVFKQDEVDIDIVKCWKFQLGGYLWEIDAHVLHDWFRFPKDGILENYNDKDVHDFWRKISGEEFKGDKHKSTSIKTPKWKLIHKFLSGVVYVRTSYGRIVSRADLELMMMIRDGRKVDWVRAITRGFLENLRTTSLNKGLGGGSFVTWMAMKLNFTFDGLEVVKERLHLSMMRARHILGKGLTWKNPPQESGEESGAHFDESDHEGHARPTDIPSSSAHPHSSRTAPPKSSSSVEQKLDFLLEMAEEQRVFRSYVVDHLKWNERTLTTITHHLGIHSKVDPPPVNPYEPQASRPAPRPSKGKEKVGEPSLLSPHMVDSSIQQAMAALTPSEEDEDVVARFIVAPHSGAEEGAEDVDENTRDNTFASALSTPSSTTPSGTSSFL